MDVGLYVVSIKNSQPIQGGRDVRFKILALVEYLENFVTAAPSNIEFPFVLIFGQQHPGSHPHFRHSNLSVHLQDHMHPALTLLTNRGRHRIEGTLISMHVIIHSQGSGA